MPLLTNQFASTMISGGTYDDELGIMTLTFTSGNTYTYHDVPQTVWDRLVAAPSAGREWHNSIKDQYF